MHVRFQPGRVAFEGPDFCPQGIRNPSYRSVRKATSTTNHHKQTRERSLPARSRQDQARAPTFAPGRTRAPAAGAWMALQAQRSNFCCLVCLMGLCRVALKSSRPYTQVFHFPPETCHYSTLLAVFCWLAQIVPKPFGSHAQSQKHASFFIFRCCCRRCCPMGTARSRRAQTGLDASLGPGGGFPFFWTLAALDVLCLQGWLPTDAPTR